MTAYFLITAFVVVIIPGTGVLYILAIGLGQGRHAVVYAALGCTLGILPHLTAAIFGLATVLHNSALLFSAVKWIGVAYLLYLGWQMVRSGGPMAISSSTQRESVWRITRRGALINILNPKLSIFFLALLPPFLSDTAENATREMITLGAVFMAMTFIVFIFYGRFSTIARDRVLSNQRVMKLFNRSFAALFVILGAKLATEHL
jgi:threonine/homoserine/homoserine lactone efflux protein